MKKSLLLFALVLLLAGCASTGNQTAPAGGTPVAVYYWKLWHYR